MNKQSFICCLSSTWKHENCIIILNCQDLICTAGMAGSFSSNFQKRIGNLLKNKSRVVRLIAFQNSQKTTEFAAFANLHSMAFDALKSFQVCSGSSSCFVHPEKSDDCLCFWFKLFQETFGDVCRAVYMDL